MGIYNLLTISKELIDVSVDGIGTVKLQWIGYAIKWLFDLFSGKTAAFALGAIVFTLALKTLVLPLDIYSRVKMKKQSLLMEHMRPQMEKLQKQYSNDKNMYNQKVLELQRANGYNPLAACLPTIISLVIFMAVFSAFSQYSQYANLTSYNNMAKAYSNAVQQYVLTEDKNSSSDQYFLIASDSAHNPLTENLKIDEEGNYYLELNSDGTPDIITIEGYYIDYAKFETYYVSQGNKLPANWDSLTESEKNGTVDAFVRLAAREAAANYYEEHRHESSLFWIGNVWYPDSMFNKEVPTFANFRSSITRAAGSMPANYEQSYNEVTYNFGLDDGVHKNYKDSYNGYFVLIVLAIGLMFLQQFITMRSQKAASELSSVDGSAAQTNKMMMIFMPIIFGIFSFMYSAAFSIYMIINTAYSLISTLIINKMVSVRFEKKQEMQQRNKAANRAGRKRLK